ncbi:hypothetical protein [Croceiramulus getboli]|nr:hypothetical protein P8624_07955 [Flavobacteriaceae bacterium YJPT1-3]
MKKFLLTFVLASILIACGGVRRSEKALARGNYDQVISQTIDNLKTNKTAKRKQPYIELLKTSYVKAVDRDLRRFKFLEKENNANTLQERYEILVNLNQRQERIRPLLPLPGVSFKMEDYSYDIVSIKEDLSKFLLANSEQLLKSSNKFEIRQAYEDLAYLNDINPGYGNTSQMMDQALALGKTYIRIAVQNQTEIVLPRRLEEDLLNLDTYNLNDLWTEYHNRPLPDFNYDYEMVISFQGIQISPEQVKERELIQEKVVKDGFEYVLDENGNVKKDSLGNDIKRDKFKTLVGRFYEFKQLKTAHVDAQVDLIDLRSNQLNESFPMVNDLVFEHIYARYEGERDALESNLLRFLEARPLPFPTNEQMVYDAGEELKAQLKSIMNRQIVFN